MRESFSEYDFSQILHLYSILLESSKIDVATSLSVSILSTKIGTERSWNKGINQTRIKGCFAAQMRGATVQEVHQ